MRCLLAAAMVIMGVALAFGQPLPEDTMTLETLTVEQAKALVKQEDMLSLDGLTTLSDEAAGSASDVKTGSRS